MNYTTEPESPRSGSRLESLVPVVETLRLSETRLAVGSTKGEGDWGCEPSWDCWGFHSLETKVESRTKRGNPVGGVWPRRELLRFGWREPCGMNSVPNGERLNGSHCNLVIGVKSVRSWVRQEDNNDVLKPGFASDAAVEIQRIEQ